MLSAYRSRNDLYHHTMGKKIQSRFTPKPQYKTYRITKRLIETLKVMQAYRFLPSNLIHALLPDELRKGSHSYEYLRTNLHEWTGHKLLQRPKFQQHSLNCLAKKTIHEINTGGKGVLATVGYDLSYSVGTGSSPWHELQACVVLASLEIAVRDQYDFFHWPRWISSAKVPDATQNSKTPFNIPITNGNSKTVVADSQPFIIKGERNLCFLGLEVDMASETQGLKANSPARKVTIRKKLENYLHITHDRIYKTHYGFPNAVIPFIFNSEARMRNAMEMLNELTHGKGSTNILFKYVPDPRVFETSVEVIQFDAFRWERVGHSDFDLHEQLKKPAK